MINIFITLGLLLLIQIYIILYITDKITNDNKESENYNKNLLKKFFEILLIIGSIYYTCKLYLKNKLSENIIEQIIIIIELIVILFWLYLNFIDNNIIDYNSNNLNDLNDLNDLNNLNELDELNNSDDLTNVLRKKNTGNNYVNIPNNNNIISNSDDDDRIFSKYISKYQSDYEFEDLYPNYKSKQKETKCEDNKIPDLTEYDGYSEYHKCYRCSCLQSSDGEEKKECKKKINGIMFGCDPKWKCNNCKTCQDCDNLSIGECRSTVGCEYVGGKCKKNPNDTPEDLPICRACSCYNRNGVRKCQRPGIGGVLIDCDNDCTKCQDCKNDEDEACSSKKFKFIELKENIDRNNIVINNISEKDLNTIL